MPAVEVRLTLIEATKLGKMVTFTDQWLAGPDGEQLAASISPFVGTDAYHPTDPARFTFLSSNDDGGQLLRRNTDDPRCDDQT